MTHRMIPRTVVAFAVALVALAFASPALAAAPVFSVDLSHSPATIRHGDERISYSVAVSNTASAAIPVGETLSCSQGTWSGTPTAFAYQWLRNGVPIGGATSSSYVTAAGDAGLTVQCQVNATNAGAASASLSNAVVVNPVPATAAPAATARPAIATTPPATATSNQTCTPGTWTGSPTFAYQWLRNGQPIAGATSSSYTVQAADVPGILQCQVTGTNAGGSVVAVSPNKNTSAAPSPAGPSASAAAAVSGTAWTSGTVYATVDLPAGITATAMSGTGWTCTVATVVCTRTSVLAPGASYPPISLTTFVDGTAADSVTATATVSGGGGQHKSDADTVSFAPGLPFGLSSFVAGAEDENGDDYTQAGGHPFIASTAFVFNTRIDPAGVERLVEHPREIGADLPDGFVGNPTVVPAKCASFYDLANPGSGDCPPASVVGVARVVSKAENAFPITWTQPVFNMDPQKGVAAQFGFTFVNGVNSFVLLARLRPDGDYSIALETKPAASTSPEVMSVEVELCGFGASAGTNMTDPAVFQNCRQADDPAAYDKPFLSNPTECSPEPPTTTLRMDSWENPGDVKTFTATSPNVTGCEQVPFEPVVSMEPTSSGADSSSGLSVDIEVPQAQDNETLATAHLADTVVTLPEGVSVNPSAAAGLEGCTDAEMGYTSIQPRKFTADEPTCPEGSKIGTASLYTSLLETSSPGAPNLTGEVYLGSPKSTDPTSGEMFRMFLVLRNRERGLLVKIPGSAVADPETGQLTATFDSNPQLPFETLNVELKGGPKGILAMPQTCGEKPWSVEFTPWSAAHNAGGQAVTRTGNFEVEDCPLGFAPSLTAGMSNSKAGQNGDFSFRFSRTDGEQWFKGLTAKLPQGLLAKIAGVTQCTGAQADAGACPAESRIGTVDAGAGSGTPYFLEKKGDAYLTQGYKGAPYGLAVEVPVEAGPFKDEYSLGKILVRQALHVDPATAQVTAVSDPFPTIWHGIPLRVREVTVKVDRAGFMLNPSDCTAQRVDAQIASVQGQVANVSTPFQASDCAALPFQPKLSLALIGKRQVTTGKHPGVKAQVNQTGLGEAGIENALVRLPKSLALDPNNAQALCEFADGTKPDLENHCPKGSVVGRARAKTPLLNHELTGNVYFVKNVRKDPKTGNTIRTLPMLIVALRGEIAINLKGESSTTKDGRLVNTFASVPDAPISQFNLNIAGGKTGILAVTQTRQGRINVCAARQIAEADLDGQNGRRHDFDVRIKTPCTKKQRAAAKRAAAKARKARR